MDELNSLIRKVIRAGAGLLLTVCVRQRGGWYILIYKFITLYGNNIFAQFCMNTKLVEIFRGTGAI